MEWRRGAHIPSPSVLAVEGGREEREGGRREGGREGGRREEGRGREGGRGEREGGTGTSKIVRSLTVVT